MGEISALELRAKDDRLDSVLEQISRAEFGEGRGMLPVLVVHKTGDQMPGPGFFKLAQELKVTGEDKEAIWIRQFRYVTDCWRTRPKE